MVLGAEVHYCQSDLFTSLRSSIGSLDNFLWSKTDTGTRVTMTAPQVHRSGKLNFLSRSNDVIRNHGSGS